MTNPGFRIELIDPDLGPLVVRYDHPMVDREYVEAFGDWGQDDMLDYANAFSDGWARAFDFLAERGLIVGIDPDRDTTIPGHMTVDLLDDIENDGDVE